MLLVVLLIWSNNVSNCLRLSLGPAPEAIMCHSECAPFPCLTEPLVQQCKVLEICLESVMITASEQSNGPMSYCRKWSSYLRLLCNSVVPQMSSWWTGKWYWVVGADVIERCPLLGEGQMYWCIFVDHAWLEGGCMVHPTVVRAGVCVFMDRLDG